ncbi:hypothetical protein [Neisseria dentiae]|uniref:hypothetical protein n=1 Tax=Neisseria dentiae TaxID=194197 RepID=UPI00359FEC73
MNHYNFLKQSVLNFRYQFRYKDTLDIHEDGNNSYNKFLIYSNKQNLRYELGFFHDELFVYAPIYQPSYPVFRLMNDEFWKKMLSLNEFAHLKFFQNSANDYIKNKFNRKVATSPIFELIKNFVLVEEYNSYNVDMGGFDITFHQEKPESELMNDVINALNVVYFLNNELAKKCTKQFISKNYLNGYMSE